MVRRILVLTAAAVAATTLVVASAGATISAPGRIGPNQAFIGLVNGKSGAFGHARIRVACPGPVSAGETTHPLAHQPLEVTRPASIATTTGNTGAHGTSITAFMGIPPTAATSGLATFKFYGVKKPIPTTINVPCSGSGFVTFVPFPRAPGTAKSFVVPVDFVNIAV